MRDGLLQFVLTDAVPALHQGRTVIQKARAEVAERRSKLKVEGPDPSDIAAAFRRMEIRTRLREMKPDELTKYFARYGDDLPTEIAQAVTELPAEYSGVPQSRHDLLTERASALLSRKSRRSSKRSRRVGTHDRVPSLAPAA